ncbi:MAG: hypothetical protein R2795_07225 [Saprospiraceae bacterium]
MDNNFFEYFTHLDSREGIYLWMVMLIAFLFGFLIAYLLRSGKIRRIKKEWETSQHSGQTATTQLSTLQAQLQQRNKELQEESQQRVALMDKLSNLENDKRRRLQEVVSLNQQIEELSATIRNHEAAYTQLQAELTACQEQTNVPRQFGDTPERTPSDSQVQALNSRLGK